MSRMLLDAGALIALDRDNQPMWKRLARALSDGRAILTHAAIVGQAWRGSARQAKLRRALRAIEVRDLDLDLGERAGELLAASRTHDVIDAALVLLCRAGDRIYTSDPEDLLVLANAARIEDIEIVRV